MRAIPSTKPLVLLVVALSANVLSAPQQEKTEGWPWRLYVSKEDALKVTGFGRFTQKKDNEFQSEPAVFLGDKAVTTLIFRDRGLDAVRVELYRGSDKARAIESWCKLFAWQKDRYGEVETFASGISKRADDLEVRKKTEEWLASRPTDKVVKLYTNCFEKGTARRFVTFLVRTPQDYLVYTVYGSL